MASSLKPCRAVEKAIHSPSGEKAGMSIISRRMSQPLQPAAVRPDSIDLVIIVALAGERDPISARRPCGERVEVRAGFEPSALFRRDIQYVEVPGRSLGHPRNTTCFPSGDQLGMPASHLPCVSALQPSPVDAEYSSA